MATNTVISRRTNIYAKAAVSDPDTMYFQQAMEENDSTQFLKAAYKEFVDLLSKVTFELIPLIIVPQGETILPAV